jgi:hypothetical protein
MLAAALALSWSGAAGAADILIPGKITIIKDTKLFKAIHKGVFALPTPGGGSDPTANASSVEVIDTGGPGTLTDALGAGTWTGLGNPAGSSGYKYKNAGAPAGGAVKLIILKEKVIKILAKDDGTLNGPVTGEVGITLAVGSDNYCSSFGGTEIKNQTGLVKRKDAPPPGACPTVGTTSTTLPASCCNGDPFISFETTNAMGDCGDIIDAGGATVSNINCAGLYTGGGGNSVPLPYALPDQSNAVSAVASCTGTVANLGPTTSTETGTPKNCTSSGCFFGAPLPVPNPGSTPTSVCVVNRLSSDISGTVDCSTGDSAISAPLSSVLFLSGDTSTDPASTIPGIQPCPLCSGGNCIGGTNNGMACIAGTSALNASFPTSNDCPPDPMNNIGTLPVAFALTSGTITWTGNNATNDTGGTQGVQGRVFSGFCRDTDGTGAFQGSTPATAVPCWENGMAVDTVPGGGLDACSGVFETCEQRNNGAFGPAGGNNRTIRAIGDPNGFLGGPTAGTLVSIFTIRPTFDATVDAAGDLPGPGAVALPGVSQGTKSSKRSAETERSASRKAGASMVRREHQGTVTFPGARGKSRKAICQDHVTPHGRGLVGGKPRKGSPARECWTPSGSSRRWGAAGLRIGREPQGDRSKRSRVKHESGGGETPPAPEMGRPSGG